MTGASFYSATVALGIRADVVAASLLANQPPQTQKAPRTAGAISQVRELAAYGGEYSAEQSGKLTISHLCKLK